MLQGRQVSKETDVMSWLIWTTYKLIINSRPQGIPSLSLSLFSISMLNHSGRACSKSPQSTKNDQYQERHPQTDISHSTVLFRPVVKVGRSPDIFIDCSRPENAEQGCLYNKQQRRSGLKQKKSISLTFELVERIQMHAVDGYSDRIRLDKPYASMPIMFTF